MSMHLPPQSKEDPRNLIVNYIPTPVSDAELWQLFEQYGELESARVIVDRVTQHPKGYGFVKFKSEDCARVAMEKMNGFEMHNKRLKVTPARGPQSAAINNHTARLQAIPGLQRPGVLAPPPPPPPPMQQQHQQQQHVVYHQVIPQYVVMDQQGGMNFLPPGTQPMGQLHAMHQQQQQQHQQQQHQQQQGGATDGAGLPMFAPFRPLSPNNDPMYRESCTFSLSRSHNSMSQPGLSTMLSPSMGGPERQTSHGSMGDN